MKDFNFDEQLSGLGKIYESGKDSLQVIMPRDLEGQRHYSQAYFALGAIRDLCGVTLQHLNAVYKQLQEKLKFKPHPDYDFEHEDAVYVQNSDGSRNYFMLIYAPDTADWVLVPFTDETFTVAKVNAEGRTFAEPLRAYGYDLLNRLVDDVEDQPEENN